MTWNKRTQDSYFQIAVSMAATIAAQIRPKIANCLNEWYYGSAEVQQKRHAEMMIVIEKYPEYHPTTVVLAYVEDACGRFETGQAPKQ